ncbi:hypothetical protein HOY82DRAFT_636531 [Tuber indicum]|nr:hypothetical protein HOY82DRAFT_636531 [Tuber indicum]
MTVTIFWRNMEIKDASDVFNWTNAYRWAALGMANSLRKLASGAAAPVADGRSWVSILYPRDRFLRDMWSNFRRLYGESSWGGIDVLLLLNTCATCRQVTTGSDGPLLNFSIRFDGSQVLFRHFPRQIVVPTFQRYTSPGETLLITPALHDPHQSWDDLATNTDFQLPSKFSWLKWDQVRQAFLGTVPESLVTEAQPNALSKVGDTYTVHLPVMARTVTAFTTGVQYETRVRAEVNIRIYHNPQVRSAHSPEGKSAQGRSNIGPFSYPTSQNVTVDHTEGALKSPDEPEHMQCPKCSTSLDMVLLSKALVSEDHLSHDGDCSLVFLWGKGFKGWMNIVLHTQQRKIVKDQIASNTDSAAWNSLDIDFDGGETGIPLDGYLKAFTGATGVFYENNTSSLPSLSVFGPIATVNRAIPYRTRGRQPVDIFSRSSTAWSKVILQELLKTLSCFSYNINQTIKINIHVGMEAVSGFDVMEIKAISKAIVLFGGLLNRARLCLNPSHNTSCLAPTERVLSNIRHIQAIDNAPSIEHLAQLMKSLEPSGSIYQGEPGMGNQRYDFRFLGSQRVIIWSQDFTKPNDQAIIDWISMILLFNRAAISTNVSLFTDYAEKPITRATLNRFLGNAYRRRSNNRAVCEKIGLE